jgi:FMN-dependent oxidoreductase (nitrilotriacetate monooxygenase family)
MLRVAGERSSDHGTLRSRQGIAEVVHGLWDSWEDDAFGGDKASARFVDTSKVHPVAHRGTYYTVAGPLNVPRSPQGRPVTVQAGGSNDGRDLAAAQADAVFTLAQTIEEGAAYARDLRARAALRQVGRLHRYSAGARDGDRQHRGRSKTAAGRTVGPRAHRIQPRTTRNTLQIDPSLLELDKPLPDPLPLPANANHTMFQGTVSLARRGNLTVRQLLRALGGGVGHRIIVGTPVSIADDIEAWFRAGAADGFNLMPDVLPSGLEVFVEAVVPILQSRGLFRKEYSGSTLRDHFHLSRSPSHFAKQLPAAASA